MVLEDKTIPEDFAVDETLAAAIRDQLDDGKLACATAFKIAAAHDVTPLQVGRTADVLQIHLTRCQLGLFGYPGHTKGWDAAHIADQPIPDGLPAALQSRRDTNGNLACLTLWQLAKEFHVSKMLVGYLADQLNIKITPCQLGAF